MMLYQKIEENAEMQKKLEQAQMDQSLMLSALLNQNKSNSGMLQNNLAVPML